MKNIIGDDLFGELVQQLGGVSVFITVDRETRDAAIKADYRRNADYSLLAAKYKLSERRIRQIVD
jgi:Mor family transcriptional regulator